MKLLHGLLTFAFTLVCVTCVSAQSFFWSTSGFGEGAVNGDFEATVDAGTSGTTYLYFDAAGVQNITEGFDLDFSWDVSGVLEFTAAETFDFDITITDIPIGQRWGDFAGPANSVSADSVETLIAINTISGTGIQVDNIPPGSPFIDEGYDETAGAFLVASFDWAAVSPGQASIVIDNALVVNAGVALDTPFSGFTVNVVPEPTSAVLLACSLIAMTAIRRRSC